MTVVLDHSSKISGVSRVKEEEGSKGGKAVI
jgi:hypothetical protein